MSEPNDKRQAGEWEGEELDTPEDAAWADYIMTIIASKQGEAQDDNDNTHPTR